MRGQYASVAVFEESTGTTVNDVGEMICMCDYCFERFPESEMIEYDGEQYCKEHWEYIKDEII